MKSICHDQPFTSKLIPDIYKSSPFKPQWSQTDFEHGEFSKLSFEAYCEFFGFDRSSLYKKLKNNRLADGLSANIQIEIVEQDTFVPYHFIKPAVAQFKEGLNSGKSECSVENDFSEACGSLSGYLKLHDQLYDEAFHLLFGTRRR